MSNYTLTKIGNIITAQYPEDDTPTNGLQIIFERLHQDSKGVVTGEITVQNPTQINSHIHNSRVNLVGPNSRRDIARRCEEIYQGPDWRAMFESIFYSTVKRYRQGEPTIEIATYQRREGLFYRVRPYIEEGAANILYGPGGIGKSMLATKWAVLVNEGWITEYTDVEPGRVLYLDWETDADTFQERCQMVAAGLEMGEESFIPNVLYRRMAAPLSSDSEEVQRVVAEYNIGLVVVDSGGPACGGDPSDPQGVINMFMALRELQCTTLILTHVAKGQGERAEPIGSVYWRNYSRQMWSLAKEQDVDSYSSDLLLSHTKTNNGRMLSPKPWRMTFGLENDFDRSPTVRFAPTTIQEGSTLATRLPAGKRIAQVLVQGAMTADQLYEAFEGDLTKAAIKSALSRGNFVQVGAGRWGVSQDMTATPAE